MNPRALPAVAARPDQRPPRIGFAELPVWVPGDILCASDDLGWKGVAQRSYRYRGQDVEIPPMDCHMIVQYEDGLTPMDRQYDGRWTRTSCGPGHFSLLSHDADSHWHWTQGIVVSHVYLTNGLLSSLASEMLQHAVDDVKLHDVLSGADPTVQHLCRELRCEARSAHSGGALYAEALSMQLGVHLLRHYAACALRSPPSNTRLTPAQLERLRDYVDAHLCGPITLQGMAASLERGPWTLNRHLRCTLGTTAYQYLVDRRVEQARQLLEAGRTALKDVAAAAGFSDQAHMTRTLPARLGVTPGQPEIERWLNDVADRLDLRRDIHFNTTITRAHYDEARARWTLETQSGRVIDAQYFITCGGMLSAPMERLFAGQASFKGRIFHTGRWPKEPIDFSDKRVGVVGIGATGIQVIQTIAERCQQLKVFIRTPQYVLPMKNPKYGEQEVAWYKGRVEELRRNLPNSFTGFEYDFEHKWADLTPAQRRGVLEEIYADGSLKLWLAGFAEMFFDEQVSEEVSEFVREKMRARLKDERLIQILVPSDYGFGTHRVPLETQYLEVYHRPNVEAVSVKSNPIMEIVPEGIRLADGTVHELDVIVLATGFDAGTGALTRIDIRGRGGRSLKDEWFTEIRTTMGLAKHGYPNMLTTAVPLAPSAALCNMTTCLQQQTEWITGLLRHMKSDGKNVVEPSAEAEDAWVRHHDAVASANLISKTSSWYVGSNVPGKPRRVLSYTGGVGDYKRRCDAVAAAGYPGFEMR